MPTSEGFRSSSSATRSRNSPARGPILGAASTSVVSTLTMRYPAFSISSSARFRKIEESASFQRGSPGGKKLPISPAETAPSSASVIACRSTSPSECPASPSGCSIARPPIFSGTPGLNACESQPYPILMFISFPFVQDILSAGFKRHRLAPQVKLRQFQVAGLRDLEVRGRALHHGDLGTGALHQAGFVGADEAVGGGLGKGAFEQLVAEALRRLRLHD